MKKPDRICAWALASVAGCFLLAMISIAGCGEDTSPAAPADRATGVDEALQAEVINTWLDAIYTGSNIQVIESMAGQPNVISETAEGHKWIYFRQVDLTFKVNKKTDTIEQISPGRVTN